MPLGFWAWRSMNWPPMPQSTARSPNLAVGSRYGGGGGGTDRRVGWSSNGENTVALVFRSPLTLAMGQVSSARPSHSSWEVPQNWISLLLACVAAWKFRATGLAELVTKMPTAWTWTIATPLIANAQMSANGTKLKKLQAGAHVRFW